MGKNIRKNIPYGVVGYSRIEKAGKKTLPAKGRLYFLPVIFSFLLLCTPVLQAQKVAEKTNLLSWATLSPNLGTEMALSRRWTFDVTLSYHPWKISDDISFRHWLASPELRWWYCRSFEGSFWGLHGLVGRFNVHAIPLTGLSKDYEYTGFLAGGGISYGYHLPLSRRWSLEFTVGGGYVGIEYDKFECKECREKIAEGHYNYFGITRLGMSLIYFLQ